MKTPIITIIIGEGASGGALGIGVGNKVYMLENIVTGKQIGRAHV